MALTKHLSNLLVIIMSSVLRFILRHVMFLLFEGLFQASTLIEELY